MQRRTHCVTRLISIQVWGIASFIPFRSFHNLLLDRRNQLHTFFIYIRETVAKELYDTKTTNLMRYFFVLLFLAVAAIDVFAVIYATDQSQQSVNNGITFTREASSASSHDYLVFTNNNKHDIVVTYIIEGNVPTKISLKAGESKKTTSAYKSSSTVKTIVEPIYKKSQPNNKSSKTNNTKTRQP